MLQHLNLWDPFSWMPAVKSEVFCYDLTAACIYLWIGMKLSTNTKFSPDSQGLNIFDAWYNLTKLYDLPWPCLICLLCELSKKTVSTMPILVTCGIFVRFYLVWVLCAPGKQLSCRLGIAKAKSCLQCVEQNKLREDIDMILSSDFFD